jgi:type II secretory pathway pseudopilin PulG
MNTRGLTLLEVIVIVAVIAILAALLLPAVTPGLGEGHRIGCAGNLRQLYQLGVVYSSTHKGQWPDAKGENLWLSFTRTTPPLLEPDQIEVLGCPVLREDPSPGQTDYFGPWQPASSLEQTGILGGDKRGNHGVEHGGNLLYKDGSVIEIAQSDPRWKECPKSSSALRGGRLLK